MKTKMKRITRKEWIDTYQTVLDEYENDTHKNVVISCAKCTICRINCKYCPESIFGGNTGCLYRHIYADTSRGINPHHKLLLIEYHKQAIEYLKNLKKYNFYRFQKKLVKIDNSLSEKQNG